MHGYAGKILHVDLSNSKLWVEQPDEKFYRTYLGGSAMGLYYILKHTPAQIDAFDPRNTLTFFIGGATGAPISGNSRVSVNAKSPLVNGIGDAQAGGYWPAELKFAGFDGVVVYGKSPKPVYLWVHDGAYELRDAAHLWGKVTGDVDKILKAEYKDNDLEIFQIGPAGENKVRFAAVMNMSNRAAGRTGMGAVMGSKLLKAIVVRGHSKPSLADGKLLNVIHKDGAKKTVNEFTFGLLGTPGVVMGQQAGGGLPTHNWDAGVFDGAQDISGQRLYDEFLLKRETCFACSVRCKRVVQEESLKVDPVYGGPEYETLATFGSYCSVRDMPAVLKANELANAYGVDTISCGATVAFGMDLYENEVIGQAETGGVDLRFGNGAAMLDMMMKIFNREGFGNVLAEGSARAAKMIGHGAEDYVVACKGQEFPAHMPQVKRSLGLVYAVNAHGADHESSEHDTSYMPNSGAAALGRLHMLGLDNPQDKFVLNQEKVRFASRTMNLYGVLNSACLCNFVFGGSWQLYGPEEMLNVINMSAGWNMTMDEMMTVGERRQLMMRAFNSRDGLKRADDALPTKMFKPLTGGKSDGIALTEAEFDASVEYFYNENGYDDRGIPTRSRFESVGLGWVADEVEKVVPLTK
ncbi:MAG: aldehyde ferredoxin oxidoreductase family protein [Chloroflexi bacterium]|nr:aldehyde ferredoxin oxidoreductase family protein [Chloroflexota bacterium]